MKRQAASHGPLAALFALLSCSTTEPDVGPGDAAPCGGPHATPGRDATPLACESTEPLTFGDAAWTPAPYTPLGNGADANDDGASDAGTDGGADSGDGDEPPPPNDEGGLDNGFIDTPDGGGVSFECDLFAQDCPAGEKCMPWSNDGGPNWNATRCSPLDSDPGAPGEPCTVEGSGYSGIDDCDIGAMCWDVDASGAGTCIAMCTGSADNPVCGPKEWCHIGNDGALVVCLPNTLCESDHACQCMCAATNPDPDCQPDQCSMVQGSDPETIATPAVPHYDGPLSLCPETAEPVVLYMSNDDSNSQASPAIVRRTIREGRVVAPALVRIHEFLNYYDFASEDTIDTAAHVGLEMRRTNAEAGELTLMLFAHGQTLGAEDRPCTHLVFSLDTSGSMAGERLELLKETMFAIAGSLRAGDVVSVVRWSSDQQVILDGHVIAGPSDDTFVETIDALGTGGKTDLHSGLTSAYALAAAHRIEGGLNRVVLISDGGANLGITALDVIASAAGDADGEGTYLVGVGVGTADGYRDDLMNAATDAGKGAYVFVDDKSEAHRQFGEHFLANIAVSARNVRMQLTLPWYFGIRAFHGEQISGDPAEVEPQHLAPNDVMGFHQIVAPCDPSLMTVCDAIMARVDYTHPITGETLHDEVMLALGDIVQLDATRLRKADAIVGYAKALIVIGMLVQEGQNNDAIAVATQMNEWLYAAAQAIDDPELYQVAQLMADYAAVLAAR